MGSMKKSKNQDSTVTPSAAFDKLIEEEPKFKMALSITQKATQTDDPILILGATAPNKELC